MTEWEKYKFFRTFLKSKGQPFLKEWVKFKSKIPDDVFNAIQAKDYINSVVVYESSFNQTRWAIVNAEWVDKCRRLKL